VTTEKELAKTYSPKDHEAQIHDLWIKAGAFHAPVGDEIPGDAGDGYSVVIPPPNVTAALHLGHALNNSLQDVMVRYNRMLGRPTLWMPGTDHAGISTQTVVEKRLLKQGIKRLEIGREKFLEKTQEWKDEYEGIIVDQLRVMGSSCDFDRTRFTMDEICSVAVRHAFYELFKDGLIYRGKRLVNWDPVTQTALSDDEVEMEEVHGHMWYLNYPLEDGSGFVTVATTRPETMLGDSGVAINPDDPKAAELVGKNVVLPIVGRVIPIVEDDYVVLADEDSSDVKAQYASGFLKVTPAHDPNDWDIGLRHELAVINVMAADGSISDAHGWEDVSDEASKFVGLSREDARQAIVKWFDDNGLLNKVREYSHSVGHSYRSHVPIEPWLSDQWYVAVTDDRLRGSAMRSQNPKQANFEDDSFNAGDAKGDGELTFYPERYAKTFQNWHENIRDWCISRQLWWGHQIPVWMKISSIETSEYANALDSSSDERVLVESDWSARGASHLVRKSSDTEIEEAICVPPQSTLGRLETSESDEAKLIADLEAAGYVRDPDVLDTWFSSGLWPLSTMGWPYPEDFPETVGLLETYNPTSVLMTAREIITLWVSRMTMFNRYFLDGQVPFKDVFIHAMIQDGHGQKMSKSLGNGVDPRDIIFSHGADAMRFALVGMTTDTQDVRMPVDVICPHTGESFDPEYITTSAGHVVAAPEQACPSDPSKKMVTLYGVATGAVEASEDVPLARNSSPKFDAGRNFVNKVWNATRFALTRLDSETDAQTELSVDSLSFVDRWIIARLDITLNALDDAFKNYQYSNITEIIYDFIWRDLSDVYLEAVKPTVSDSAEQQVVLASMFDAVMRILHPVCPFVTEALWPSVSGVQRGKIDGVNLESAEVLAKALWPSIDSGVVDASCSDTMERVQRLVTNIRNLRAARNVKPKQLVDVYVSEVVMGLIDSSDGIAKTLASVGEVIPISDERPESASSFTFEGEEVLVSSTVDAADVEAEKKRLEKDLESKQSEIKNLEGRLSNKNYVEKAKPELVQQTRDGLEAAQKDLVSIQAALDAL